MFLTLIHTQSVLAAFTALYALRCWLQDADDYGLLNVLTAGYVTLFVVACIVGLVTA